MQQQGTHPEPVTTGDVEGVASELEVANLTTAAQARYHANVVAHAYRTGKSVPAHVLALERCKGQAKAIE